MQLNAPHSSPAELDVTLIDMGPLVWVLDELRKSLDGASKALKRFVHEAELAKTSELAALDASQLRIARQQLHQAVGALEMVGMSAPALVLRSMEAAVQRFVQSPMQCTEDAASKIEQAGVSLVGYLEDVLAGKTVSAVSLFPQYRDIQGLVGADRVHPADLWVFEWRWIEPSLELTADPKAYDDASRQQLDKLMLNLIRTGDPQAAQSLSNACLGFATIETVKEARTFWKIAAGFFEALAQGLLKVDLYVKRATLRVLLQYVSLAQGNDASARFAQDLLFLCTQADTKRSSSAPVLAAVRASYGLSKFEPVDYESVQFGRISPALIAQARKCISLAKETWSMVTEGDVSKLKVLVDQFSQVADLLVRLHPPSQPFALVLSRVIDATARSGQAPRAELGLEVATSVLYLEAVFDDFDPNDPQLWTRTARLAERLESTGSGGPAMPLESWMEELYQHVNDKQTMASVVGELRASLAELEKSLDNFFRNPQDKAILVAVRQQLNHMRSVLSVLGLDEAALAVLHMCELVVKMLETDMDEHAARDQGIFDRLGNNLGSLSFLIDMLNYQPALAKKHFVFDAITGELKGGR